MVRQRKNEHKSEVDRDSKGDNEIVISKIIPKKPPPESEREVRTRRQVVAAFWIVVIFFGIPLWWWTTTVYRASLPLQEMITWSDGKVGISCCTLLPTALLICVQGCHLEFPVYVALSASEVADKDAQHLLELTQVAVDNKKSLPVHQIQLKLAPTVTKSNYTDLRKYAQVNHASGFDWDSASLLMRLTPKAKLAETMVQLHPYAPILDVFYQPDVLHKDSTSQTTLAEQLADTLQNIYSNERDSLSNVLPSKFVRDASSSDTSASDEPAKLTNSFKHAPSYHLTISLFTPSFKPSSWEIEKSLEEYIIPLLDSFSSISKFTVDTQVQLYSKYSPLIREPEYKNSQNAWMLRKDDLSGFVNAAEWPLSPSIGVGPTINFVLYVPDEAQAPLIVEETGGNSWLIPQWGGVFIYNPPSEKPQTLPTNLDKDSLKPAMQVFAQQLFSLLGLPESPDPLPLRLSTMTRTRIASLAVSASSTLGALARLTQSLPSIAIPDNVAVSVDKTISHLQNTCKKLDKGNHREALEAARIAEAEAEKAFFEPSMVGQVYFPEEHKVAVYLPLLGPMAVPLVISALKEIKRFVNDYRENKK